MAFSSLLRRANLPVFVLAAAVLAGSSARADVPAPVGDPPPDGGGTTVTPPPPPAEPPPPTAPGPPAVPPGVDRLPPIPPPADRGSNPAHPDPNVGNHPPRGWYDDMHRQIYDTNDQFSRIERWAYHEYASTGYEESWNIYVCAAYLRVYTAQYYWNAYEERGYPRSFSWGYPSRGDFNYGYHFYIRPVYLELLNALGGYYGHHAGSPGFDYPTYGRIVKPAIVQYHRFTRCNFGKNGKDALAKDDDRALALARTAGIALSPRDILQ